MTTYAIPLDADVVSLFSNNDDAYATGGDLEIDLPSPSSRLDAQPTLHISVGFDTDSPTNLILKCTAGSMTVGTSTLSTYTIASPGAVFYAFKFYLVNNQWRGDLEMTGPAKYW